MPVRLWISKSLQSFPQHWRCSHWNRGGRRKARPERVDRACGRDEVSSISGVSWGSDCASCNGGRPRRGGCATGTGLVRSTCAGFKRSIEITSSRSPTITRKVLPPGATTWKGPSYGRWSGPRWPSWRMKTNLELRRDFGTYDCADKL
ncbi:RNA-directed DNA polymerase from mobile element jockey [Plakobranchus ocellatus]|uniref:RNA-directed DNA polymerase from mobile element jockey n=1 Tax=Plakobranchus ocellatus TaxID=259542 RepID=A0AAV3YZG4_9GAST|nr:RNA-directed DNA polymerase from mobile element jockey [Plakobranchus ocellatus]